MGKNRNWTEKETQYLMDNWGTLSLHALAQNLNRSENTIKVRKNRLGLGAFLDNGDYITWNQLSKTVFGSNAGTYRMKSWVKNRKFPIHTKKVGSNSFRIVFLDEWWEWAEKNKDLLDFSKFEENMLGVESDWVKTKRKLDFEKGQKYRKTPWTKTEDDRLRRLVSKQKYTYDDLSKMLRRTNGAIQKRLIDLKIKDRPVKADNHTKWTDEDFQKLGEMIKSGYGYDLIAERIGKSSKACRGRVYQTYLTENLDKVRDLMGNGEFGDHRPERTIRQRNAMNTEERIECREAMTSLASILKWKFKQDLKDTEWGDFFQKDMCQNFCGECLSTTGCDECENYKKIEPQVCKMCGKTFYERKENNFCTSCRDMRKKQYLRKQAVLNLRTG